MKIQIKKPKTKCQYCGKTFTKTHNRQTYCSEQCRQNSRKEKRRKYNTRYYYKNRKKIHTKYLGTNTLAPNRNNDPEREAEIIQNEIHRLGIKS